MIETTGLAYELMQMRHFGEDDAELSHSFSLALRASIRISLVDPKIAILELEAVEEEEEMDKLDDEDEEDDEDDDEEARVIKETFVAPVGLSREAEVNWTFPNFERSSESSSSMSISTSASAS